MGFRESKNRPVATNFQFLKILAPLGQLLVGACLPQTLLGDFILGGCYIAYMPFQILIFYIFGYHVKFSILFFLFTKLEAMGLT